MAAELVALSLPCFRELCWVLSSAYANKRADIAQAVRRQIGPANVAVDRTAVEAGLATLGAGADCTDGVIAGERA